MCVSLKANTTGKPEARKGKDKGQASSCHYKAKCFLKEEEEREEEEEVLSIVSPQGYWFSGNIPESEYNCLKFVKSCWLRGFSSNSVALPGSGRQEILIVSS